MHDLGGEGGSVYEEIFEERKETGKGHNTYK